MAVIVAFAIAVVSAPVAARVATRLGIVDHPGPLKVQTKPVPYLGGVAVFVGLAVPLAWAKPSLLVPLALAGSLGLADDVTDLPARVRLPCEALIGVVAALCVPTRGPVGALALVVITVVLINAVNLLDGLDGLACGVSIAAAAGFAALLHDDFRVAALAVGGAVAGVLVWNRPPARLYLGDAGSYLIGTALALLLGGALAPGEPVATGAAALLLVGVPVIDTSVAIVRRFRAHRPLLQGDRGHVYDQLVDRGWRPIAATGACVGAQAALAVAAIAIAQLSAGAAVVVAAIVIALVGGVVLLAFTTPGSWARDLD